MLLSDIVDVLPVLVFKKLRPSVNKRLKWSFELQSLELAADSGIAFENLTQGILQPWGLDDYRMDLELLSRVFSLLEASDKSILSGF